MNAEQKAQELAVHERIIEYFTDNEAEIIEIGDEIYYSIGGYYYSLPVTEFDATTRIQDTMSDSTLVSSCCGEASDKDRMICPRCKEHF